MTRKTDEEILQEAREWCADHTDDHYKNPFAQGIFDNLLEMRAAIHFINQREDALEQLEAEQVRADKLERELAKDRDWMRACENRLAEAATWFREYELSHTKKGDEDKAARNRRRAEFCETPRSEGRNNDYEKN